MNIHDTGSTYVKSSKASPRFAALRDQVFEHWTRSVIAEIPEAAQLRDDLCSTSLLRFFDEIANALNGSPSTSREVITGNLISPHARGRAKSTAYGPRELLHEFQIFRQTVFEVADANNILLEQRDRSVIDRIIDAGALQAMDTFAVAHREIGETFIACLAHDLRNPLNVANASAQLIQSKSNDDNVLRLARRVCAKLINVDEMIGTLLDAMAVNGRKKLRLKITSFDIKALVDEITVDMSSPGSQIVSTGEPSHGFWCRSSMKRVIENILSNAQKYGALHSPIKIHTKKTDGSLVLTFHNEGSAIPEQELPRLFSAFHRLADVDIKGWGLGLPLVQLVVESHGGTVDVSSTAALGTTFTIKLPTDCQVHTSESACKR